MNMPSLIYKSVNDIDQVVVITGRPVVVGRVKDSDIVVRDTFVSRTHCEITYVAGEFILKDLGSTNGTYRDGNKVYQCKLVSGDRIQMGNTTLLFVINKKTGDATLSHSADLPPPLNTKRSIKILEKIRGQVKTKKPVIVKMPAQLTKSS